MAKLKALQTEYWALQEELQAIAHKIKTDWESASVGVMRGYARRLDEINSRLYAIKGLKSFDSLSERIKAK